MEIIELSKFIYTSALPVITFLALIYTIYLHMTRKSYLKEMEEDFYNSIQRNEKASLDTLDVLSSTMKEVANANVLMFRENIEENISRINVTIQRIGEAFRDVSKKQDAINSKLDKLENLQKENERLKEELKKRDVFVERKNQQISRMKQKDKENY